MLPVIRVFLHGLGPNFAKGLHTLLRGNVPKERILGRFRTVQSVQKNRFRFRFRVRVRVRVRVRARLGH